MPAQARLLINHGAASLDDVSHFHQDVELAVLTNHGHKRSPSIASTSSSSSSSAFSPSSSSSLVASPSPTTTQPRRAHQGPQDALVAASRPATPSARHACSLSIDTPLPSPTSLGPCPSPSLAIVRRMTADQRRKLADKIWREICWTRQDKIKRGVWAAAFAAVVFVGSITGAQLKSDRQKDEAIDEFRQTSASEQIAILETQKESLLKQRAVLERKKALFRERVQERESGKNDRPK